MIDLGDKSHCVCKKHNNTQKECVNQYTVNEKGKSIQLAPKNTSEKVMLIVLDQCVITDNHTKCDAMYLYKTSTKKYSFLVELKGAGDLEKAFHQLSYTRDSRAEYKNILEKFKDLDGKNISEKFAIVSNGSLTKIKLEQLENHYNIRVKTILLSEATSPTLDLKILL